MDRPSRGVTLPLSHFPPVYWFWSLLVRAVRYTHRVCPLDLCCSLPYSSSPEDTNNTIVGSLLNRPNYTLTGLAPKPSPDAKTRMLRVWVSGWDFTPPEGPQGSQPAHPSSVCLRWVVAALRWFASPSAAATSLWWQRAVIGRIWGKAAIHVTHNTLRPLSISWIVAVRLWPT